MDRFKSFVGYIQELNRCLSKIKDIEMKKFGLRAGHAMCLYQLSENEKGLTSSQLTKLCGEDKATISRLLSELLEKGFVLPDGNDSKNYRTPYRLTESGKELSRRVHERVQCAVSYGGAGLTDGERESLYHAFEIISGNLSRYLNKQKAETKQSS